MNSIVQLQVYQWSQYSAEAAEFLQHRDYKCGAEQRSTLTSIVQAGLIDTHRNIGRNIHHKNPWWFP